MICTRQKEELPVAGAAAMSIARRNHYLRHPYRELAIVQIEVDHF